MRKCWKTIAAKATRVTMYIHLPVPVLVRLQREARLSSPWFGNIRSPSIVATLSQGHPLRGHAHRPEKRRNRSRVVPWATIATLITLSVPKDPDLRRSQNTTAAAHAARSPSPSPVTPHPDPATAPAPTSTPNGVQLISDARVSCSPAGTDSLHRFPRPLTALVRLSASPNSPRLS